MKNTTLVRQREELTTYDWYSFNICVLGHLKNPGNFFMKNIQIFRKKIQTLVRQREEGLYAQVAAGNLLLVLASWPISYTQDKTRQHLPLFLSFFLFFFSNLLHSRQDQRILVFISYFPSIYFPFFSKLFLTFAFACVP